MEIKQEPKDSFIKEEILDIKEQFLPNVIDMWNNRQDNDEIINEIKNELVSVKNENCTYPGYFQQTCSNHEHETDQNIYGANADRLKGSVQRKYFKQSKIGRPLNVKNMNKQHAINGIIICTVCGKLYLKQVEYLYHYSIHHSLRRKKLYKSQFSRRDTGDLTNLEDVKHEIEIVHELKEELEDTKNCAQFKHIDNYKAFKCEVCAKHFSLESNLNTHIRSHTDRNISLKYFLQKSYLTTYMPYQKEKQLKRDIFCLKHFSRKYELKSHKQRHEGEKGFKCDICLKYFARKYHFNRHLRCHTGEKPFKCDICTKYFSSKFALSTHSLYHTGEKPFSCHICLKSFTQKGQLKVHLSYHTGEKPFKCDICLKSFSQKGSLKGHLRLHRGEKTFKCSICSKYFARKCDLNRHLLCHTREKPFKCDLCSKCFAQRSQLNRHYSYHTGEKPFNCDICLKSFSKKCRLEEHLRFHTGEKPFKCDSCAKSFARKFELNRHSLTLSHRRKTIQM